MTLLFSNEPEDKVAFTKKYDRFYTWFAGFYNIFVTVFPIWKNWISHAAYHIQGPRVLEVSFGTGYLLTLYADHYEVYGIDYNEHMVRVAKKNLIRQGLFADLRQGNVETLPYANEYFDTVVNTMAFTGYPDGEKAMSELHRVLVNGGRLVMVDINYPTDGNRLGMLCARMWITAGDLLRDMKELFHQFGFEYTDEEIGGFGSVHLYIATKIG